jgi:GrpB-like predicted nucleotidyltransferase (UPF0157 family)
VAIAPADPRWPALAADEIARLRGALGPDVRIEHVGSTAVPALDARPVIDLLIGFAAIPPQPRVPEYESVGELRFRRRGPLAFDARLAQVDSAQWRDAIALRDFLRADAEAAARYAAAKRAACDGGTPLSRYARELAPVIAEMLERARKT